MQKLLKTIDLVKISVSVSHSDLKITVTKSLIWRMVSSGIKHGKINWAFLLYCFAPQDRSPTPVQPLLAGVFVGPTATWCSLSSHLVSRSLRLDICSPDLCLSLHWVPLIEKKKNQDKYQRFVRNSMMVKGWETLQYLSFALIVQGTVLHTCTNTGPCLGDFLFCFFSVLT